MENLQLQDGRGAQGIRRGWAIAIVVGISLCWIFTGCTVTTNQSSHPQITVDELHRLASSGKELFLLDVRTEQEFVAERLSFVDDRIPVDSLAENLNRLPSDKETPIYTFCRSGRRSGIAAGYLLSQGFTRVYNVDGGIIAWKAAGFETVAGH